MLLNTFSSDEQHHLVAHHMCNLHAMTVLAERSEHKNVQLCTLC